VADPNLLGMELINARVDCAGTAGPGGPWCVSFSSAQLTSSNPPVCSRSTSKNDPIGAMPGRLPLEP